MSLILQSATLLAKNGGGYISLFRSGMK